MKKRGLALGLAFTMASSVFSMTVFGRGIEDFKDMPDNWSRPALERAVENGLLQGTDGMILPEESLTRAQMATVINRAFGAKEEGDLWSFEDVKKGDWFYSEMAKALKMGTFKGSGSKLNPRNPITRQEAFLVMARALNLQKTELRPDGYSDLGEISSWARGEIYSLIERGYVKGSHGKLNPKGNISRAEFAQLMDNIIKKYIREPGEYKIDIEGNVMISSPDVVLKSSKISGDLILGDGIGDGQVVLEDLIVGGKAILRLSSGEGIIIRGDSQVDIELPEKPQPDPEPGKIYQAKDSDFTKKKDLDGVEYFAYTGKEKNLKMPESIGGQPLTSYYKMFQGTDVEKVVSQNKNVSDMTGAFSGLRSGVLDLSDFHTSSVINMRNMFRDARVQKINLSSFSTSNVRNMSNMFYGSQVTSLDLKSFDTSSVRDMSGMFAYSKMTSLDLGTFKTENLLDMSEMFLDSRIRTLDLSTFDTSSLASFGTWWTFKGSQASQGYARSQADADLFNKSQEKPEKLKFTLR